VATIETSKQSYALSYLPDGSLSSISAGNNPLMSYIYEGNLSEKLKRVTYGNGQYYEYTYDENDNVSRVDYVNGNESHYYEYIYDSTGNITEVYDSLRDVTSKCHIDASGNVYAVEYSDGKKIAYGKDSNGKEIVKYIWDENSDVYTFNYDDNEELVSVTLPSGAVTKEQSDAFGRITDTEILITRSDNSTVSITEAFEYTLENNGKTDYLVKSLTMRDGTVYHYSYDSAGNITSVSKNNEATAFAEYVYDSLGQLLREDRADINRTYVFSYDTDGNIQTKKEYVYTTAQTLQNPVSTKTYGYSTVNGLYSLTNVNGNAITYDASGNPLTYYNGMNFTWVDGRKLSALTGNGINASYVYNGDGLRTKKTITETDKQYTVEYFYEGNKLIALEKVQGTEKDYMFFMYDQSDNIVGFELNGTAYYYSKNLQGDVLGILDSNGTKVVEYTYTAWGELVEVTGNTSLAYLNPIRYREYVYDDEIGLYYLQSRYYDPGIGRFINADSAEYIGASGTLLGNNLFAYCENNSINYCDPYGKWIRKYSSFAVKAKGFDVNIYYKFLSKKFCISFANRFLKLFGKYHRRKGYLYSGMNSIRIAKELYAHAVLYCVGCGLLTSSKVSSSIRRYFDNFNNKIYGRLVDYIKQVLGRYLYSHSKKISVNSDETSKRLIAFNFIWYFM